MFFIPAALLACLPAFAQFQPGQYTDEAPFRTWNSFPYLSAAALAQGGTAYAWGTGATASLANPALLLTLPKWTGSLGGSFQYATFSPYGPVNTGVVETSGPPGRGVFSLDHAAISFRTGRVAFSAAASLTESFDRPIIDTGETYQGSPAYRLRHEQSGFLRTFHFGAAVRLSDRLGLGVGLNYSSGRLESELLEEYTIWGYRITGAKSLDLESLSFNGGLFWEPAAWVRAALTIQAPYALSAATETVDRYQTDNGAADISIRGEAEETFDRPLIFGAGLNLRINDRVRAAVDASFVRWTSYRATWLGERQNRDFRDIVRIGAGGEYRTDVRLFGRKAVSPLRLGFIYDPQPMNKIRSSYFGLTFGSGLETGRFRVDLGALIGIESGSGEHLTARRISLDLGYVF